MHELSVCKSIIKSVLVIRQAKADEMEQALLVKTIKLRVGPLSSIVPELLLRAFRSARKGTLLETAELVIEKVPVLVFCDACNLTSRVAMNRLVCARCGLASVQLQSGDELMIESIECCGVVDDCTDVRKWEKTDV